MNSDSIKAKLKNIAVKEWKQFDYLLTLYLIERLLYRISISEYADKFVLKGGVLLYIVLEEKARATKDIDMLARQLNNSLENVDGNSARLLHSFIWEMGYVRIISWNFNGAFRKKH